MMEIDVLIPWMLVEDVHETQEDPDAPICCDHCGMLLADEDQAAFLDDGTFCEACIEPKVEQAKSEAIAFAIENCKVTVPELPEYDPNLEHRCTPEEYDSGSRESYSPNAFLCHLRHDCTNYDELIGSLEKADVWDGIRYSAILKRIYELLDDHIIDQGILCFWTLNERRCDDGQ